MMQIPVWVIWPAVLSVAVTFFGLGAYMGRYVTKVEYDKHKDKCACHFDAINAKMSQIYDKIEDLRVTIAEQGQ